MSMMPEGDEADFMRWRDRYEQAQARVTELTELNGQLTRDYNGLLVEHSRLLDELRKLRELEVERDQLGVAELEETLKKRTAARDELLVLYELEKQRATGLQAERDRLLEGARLWSEMNDYWKHRAEQARAALKESERLLAWYLAMIPVGVREANRLGEFAPQSEVASPAGEDVLQRVRDLADRWQREGLWHEASQLREALGETIPGPKDPPRPPPHRVA